MTHHGNLKKPGVSCADLSLRAVDRSNVGKSSLINSLLHRTAECPASSELVGSLMSHVVPGRLQ